MRTELVRIGNSYGIRIPVSFIRQCRLRNEVELRVENDCIVISKGRGPRDGWAKGFRAAGSSGKDELLLDEIESNQFDRTEWQW